MSVILASLHWLDWLIVYLSRYIFVMKQNYTPWLVDLTKNFSTQIFSKVSNAHSYPSLAHSFTPMACFFCVCFLYETSGFRSAIRWYIVDCVPLIVFQSPKFVHLPVIPVDTKSTTQDSTVSHKHLLSILQSKLFIWNYFI